MLVYPEFSKDIYQYYTNFSNNFTNESVAAVAITGVGYAAYGLSGAAYGAPAVAMVAKHIFANLFSLLPFSESYLSACEIEVASSASAALITFYALGALGLSPAFAWVSIGLIGLDAAYTLYNIWEVQAEKYQIYSPQGKFDFLNFFNSQYDLLEIGCDDEGAVECQEHFSRLFKELRSSILDYELAGIPLTPENTKLVDAALAFEGFRELEEAYTHFDGDFVEVFHRSCDKIISGLTSTTPLTPPDTPIADYLAQMILMAGAELSQDAKDNLEPIKLRFENFETISPSEKLRYLHLIEAEFALEGLSTDDSFVAMQKTLSTYFFPSEES